MSYHGMVHLNGNLLAVMDTETTGLVAGFHDVIQVCVMLLDSNIEPLTSYRGQDVLPFYMDLQPKRPENADARALQVNKLDLAQTIQHGIEPFQAADLFEEWFEKLGLPFGKKLCPLGANVPFDRSFMIDWLGNETYNQFFDYHIRDIQAVANFLNDRSAFQGRQAPFPKVNVAYLASQLKIDHSKSHDAMQDCLVEARIYKRMLQEFQL